MNKPFGIALLVAGIVLVVWGMQGTNSISSDFSKFFTGSPDNKSIWLIIGGILSLVTGGFLTLRPAR